MASLQRTTSLVQHQLESDWARDLAGRWAAAMDGQPSSMGRTFGPHLARRRAAPRGRAGVPEARAPSHGEPGRPNEAEDQAAEADGDSEVEELVEELECVLEDLGDRYEATWELLRDHWPSTAPEEVSPPVAQRMPRIQDEVGPPLAQLMPQIQEEVDPFLAQRMLRIQEHLDVLLDRFCPLPEEVAMSLG